MKIAITSVMAGVILSTCSEVKDPAVATPASAVSQSKSAEKGPKDYKAIFGPDYKKGDIGHSKGTITKLTSAANEVSIKHGVIHGIDRGAATTNFEVLDSANVSALSSGVNVEFLVKKGPDNIYRLFAICEILEAGKSCL